MLRQIAKDVIEILSTYKEINLLSEIKLKTAAVHKPGLPRMAPLIFQQ